ncbi:MAG: hypothetical protein JWO89_511 [Verrucomicrobiaceae bacterium]|nr:hypothetical protein [Verrucomicrobiaceae bacterium]
MNSIVASIQKTLASRFFKRDATLDDSFVPESLKHDEELLRRSRLHIRFGAQGAAFGTLYALFYLGIGHAIGAVIILLCSLLWTLGPWFLKKRGSLKFTGHYYSAILVTGFTALGLVEGGIEGHAIAWLAAIPLCALLLLDLKAALTWSAVCLVIALGFGYAEMRGLHVARTYPPEWHHFINLVGYAGLVCFLTLLGFTFERTRARAFRQMELAISELGMANQHLNKLIQEKDEFMKIAAHDLNNPLGGVLGYAELLLMFPDHPDAERLQWTQGIQSLSKRMLDIIRNLLEVKRIEEGSLRFKEERCSVETLLQGILKDHARAAERKSITLGRIPAAAPAFAVADEGAVQQILDNLVSNAVKYSPPGTNVRCACREQDGMIHIDIKDEGPGLSAEDQGKLFQKFVKLTPRPTAGENSNGLGLWIVQRMAQAMNGNMHCQSTLGQGCTFTLTLPRWQAERVAETAGVAGVVARV